MSAAARQPREPSPTGIGVAAALMALIGAALGFGVLASFSPETYANAEERAAALEEEKSEGPELIRSVNYFFTGADTSEAAGWRPGRRALLRGEPGEVRLTTRDLNAWMGSKFGGLTPAPSEEEPTLKIVPDIPVAYLRNGEMHLAIPVAVTAWGDEYELTVICEGHFARGAAPPFQVDDIRLNSAPVPLAEVAGRALLGRLANAFRQTEEYAQLTEAWQSVQSASVDGDVLRLTIR